jgi:hypothetical protein
VGSLQNSDLKGERYVNVKVRGDDRKTREREEFLKELEEIKNKRAISK